MVAPPSVHPLTGKQYSFVNKPATIADYIEFRKVIEFLQPYVNAPKRTSKVRLPTPQRTSQLRSSSQRSE